LNATPSIYTIINTHYTLAPLSTSESHLVEIKIAIYTKFSSNLLEERTASELVNALDAVGKVLPRQAQKSTVRTPCRIIRSAQNSTWRSAFGRCCPASCDK
jgi:ribosome-associated translation inhibitor RaiA